MERLCEFELMTQKYELYQARLLERVAVLESDVSRLSSLNADLSIKLSDAEKKHLAHFEDLEVLKQRLSNAEDTCDKAKHSAELSKD